MKIANAIYDVTFKYLMENETTARIMLSALLQREVVNVAMKNQEFTKDVKDEISLHRIDFSAQVRTTDGDVETITIELQKKWLRSEVLRFRRYLGMQYCDDGNISTEANRKGFGYPIVAIYILGHTLDDLSYPIVYVKRQYLDQENKECKPQRPSKFVDSISHDAIIVQIPRLKQKTQTRLERMMQIFKASTTHEIDFDDAFVKNDSEMKKVADRLNSVLTNSGMRRTMEIEDEILSDLVEKEEEIKQKDEMLSQQSEMLSQQSETISQQSETISQQSEMLSQKDEVISQKDETIKNMAILFAQTLISQNKTTEEIRSLTNLTTEEVERIRAQMQ